MKRQKIRKTIGYISLFLFPVTLYYFSPYVSIMGAFAGVMAGSVLVFLSQLITAIFFRRAWCGWLCPMAGLSECAQTINDKNVPMKKLRLARYTIFTIWFSILLAGFVVGGGVKSIQPFFSMDSFISVDAPQKYIIYFAVLFIFFLLSLLLGKRGGCHSICWMAPFLTAGDRLGGLLGIPQLKVVSEPEKCISCQKCNKKCPMSIDVMESQKKGSIGSPDCIGCAECVDVCPKQVLHLKVAK